MVLADIAVGNGLAILTKGIWFFEKRTAHLFAVNQYRSGSRSENTPFEQPAGYDNLAADAPSASLS